MNNLSLHPTAVMCFISPCPLYQFMNISTDVRLTERILFCASLMLPSAIFLRYRNEYSMPCMFIALTEMQSIAIAMLIWIAGTDTEHSTQDYGIFPSDEFLNHNSSSGIHCQSTRNPSSGFILSSGTLRRAKCSSPVRCNLRFLSGRKDVHPCSDIGKLFSRSIGSCVVVLSDNEAIFWLHIQYFIQGVPMRDLSERYLHLLYVHFGVRLCQ